MNNKELQIGDKCPQFKLPNQYGEIVDSSAFIGKKISVIFFYPKDETPGCTKEACSFRDRNADFQALGCEVIGISSDSVASHRKFSVKHELNYSILADTKKQVRKAFGVPANLFGLIPGRVTYIVDKNGIIQGIYNSQTDPFGHTEHAYQKVLELTDNAPTD